MRIDHHAYQRATRVASFGFFVQAAIGLTLLILSFSLEDTPFLFSALYVLYGLLLWLGLMVIFHQHKRERLEALEEDELAAARAGTSSVFDAAAEETRIAARRLALMYKWLLPTGSLVLAVLLSLTGWLMWQYMRHLDDAISEGGTEFFLTEHLGWAISICLSFAAISFIMSRFVAGMAKQPAWQNLRGGAGYMVGNALVLLAIAIGIIFRFFGNDQVIEAIAFAMPFFFGLLAFEIILNFILNLYRPRIPGEAPRPAFDSKVLSLFAAPDNLVRSINEAVNYQFGFDVTSSWGYQLLLRSFAWLVALGVVVLVVLNMMVIVEPHQQAIRLGGGRIVDDQVHGSGLVWKLPFPVQTSEVYDVARIRKLPLTAQRVREQVGRRPKKVLLWTDDIKPYFDEDLDPFIVASASTDDELESFFGTRFEDAGDPAAGDDTGQAVSEVFSLVDAEISLEYRIRAGDGLLDYLSFAPDTTARRQRLTVREQILRALALREITLHLAQTPLEDVLSTGRVALQSRLRDRIQTVYDDKRTGVEVVAVNFRMLRPSGTSAAKFEEQALSNQAYLQRLAEAQRDVTRTLTALAGSVEQGRSIALEISRYEDLKARPDAESQQAARELRVRVEQMLRDSGGEAAQTIADAETDKWIRFMAKRAQAARIEGQKITYRAAPRLYRQREIMKMLIRNLGNVRKYVIGIDPSRVHVNVELKELNPLLNFEDAMNREGDAAQ